MPRPPGGGRSEPPAALDDPRSLATGAVVVTLLEHRRGWVRRHAESIELRDERTARRRVDVEFELPGMAWAGAPAGAPAVVPLALVDRDAAAGAEVRDEAGAPVALLPRRWSDEIAAAGLVAIAAGAGARRRAALRRLAWRIASGSAGEATAALEELARGDDPDVRAAWAHAPFRSAAEALAGRSILLVALDEPARPHLLTYAYDERVEPARSGLDGLELLLPLPHLGQAAVERVEVEAGDDVDVATTVDERSRVARVSVRPRRGALVVPLAAALATAAFLTLAWLVVPGVDGDGGLLPLVLALPLALALYVRGAGRPLVGRSLAAAFAPLLASGALALAAAVLLASDASTAALRIAVGVAAALAWAAAALLLESWRRARGGSARDLLPRLRPPPREGAGARFDPTRAAALALAMAAGLVVVALANDAARDGRGGAYELLWLGLLVIFVPAIVNAWRAPSRGELLLGAVLLGVAFYLVKVLHSPLDLTGHDEFSTLRTTLDIQRYGEPFHQNPLIEVHPFYPALELVTSAIASVTGLSVFVSALIVIGVLRVALMTALFLVVERAWSTRVAGLAAVLYACNPNFLFFDSQWAYESFALPLALVSIAMAARGPRGAWLSVAVIAAICVAHPLTAIAVIAFLLAWWAIDAQVARRAGARARSELWKAALAGAAFLTLWATIVARETGGYLGPVVREAGDSIVDLLLGESGAKRIFGAAGVAETPVAERLLGYAAVALALAALAFGLRPLWRRFTPLAGALGAAALLYPVSLVLRLTDAGTEISNRASEFVFVGVAFLAALALTEPAPAWLRGAAGRVRPYGTAAVAALAAVLMAGGVVIGTARSSRLPGGYMVVADPRSVEPEGKSAARWAREELGTGNRLATDRINALLMGSIGLQEPQIGARSIPGAITAPRLDAELRSKLVADGLGLLVVDRRLATGLPQVGFYFGRHEPDAYRHERPPSRVALVKYDSACPVARLFDSGSLIVYDISRVDQVAECDPGVPGVEPGRSAPRDPSRGTRPFGGELEP